MGVRLHLGVRSTVVHQEDSIEDLMVDMVVVLGPLELLMEVVKPQEPLTVDMASLRVDHMASIFLEVTSHQELTLKHISGFRLLTPIAVATST